MDLKIYLNRGELKEKMKIIQIMPEFGLAGAEVMAENLAYGLKNKGHDVIMVSLYKLNTPITDRLEKQGITINYLGKKRGFDLSIVPKLRKIIKRYNPDVIHTHRYVLPYAFLSSFGLRIKRIHTVHNMAEKEVPYKQIRLQKILFRYLKVIPVAITPLTQQSIENCYGIKRRDIPLVYNGIDLSKCIKKKKVSIGEKITILHVGRFAKQKNHKMLIEAFSDVINQYPNCELKLVGNGDLVKDVKDQVYKLHLTKNVHFLGLMSDVYEIMSESDIFVLPSVYEGMPITLIEAMGTGLPIIATSVGGVPDIIEDKKSGLLINVSKQELADAIINIIKNQELRATISNGAYKSAYKFSMENMTNSYIALYEK